jgi:hypothetical protein
VCGAQGGISRVNNFFNLVACFLYKVKDLSAPFVDNWFATNAGKLRVAYSRTKRNKIAERASRLIEFLPLQGKYDI